MSLLIKGLGMPKDCESCTVAHLADCELWMIAGYRQIHKDCPLVEVPTPHGRLIDADALYERTAEWEASALHMVEKTINDEDKSGWRRWSLILKERSAFKYDVADAPTIIEAEEGEE